MLASYHPYFAVMTSRPGLLTTHLPAYLPTHQVTSACSLEYLWSTYRSTCQLMLTDNSRSYCRVKQATAAVDAYELQLVAAQDELVSPRQWFEARLLPDLEPS